MRNNLVGFGGGGGGGGGGGDAAEEPEFAPPGGIMQQPVTAPDPTGAPVILVNKGDPR